MNGVKTIYMPRSKEQFVRYKIIDRELHNKSWVTTSQLKKSIEDFLLESISERAIQKDIKAMQEDTRLGYNAPIEYSKRRGAYRYTDKNYSILRFSLQDNEITALKFYASCLGMYGPYSIFKDFSTAIDKIISGVSLKSKFGERTSNIIIQTDTIIPIMGSDFLEVIVQAIDESLMIEFEYQKFGESQSKSHTLCPYLLKEYKNRWYVIGCRKGKTSITTFGLDRMSGLKINAEKFSKSNSFDHDKYFKNSFGITRPEYDSQSIVLEFAKSQSEYIKSLPIHSTQQIIKETKSRIQISIDVMPCYELFEYILGKTPDVKVLSPQPIAEEVKRMLTDGLKNY
jgi:predicted DNA-binding transcriptional regulator YafY